ncbi:MAG: hypothetical protein K6T65_16255, partial [Peptococcaceae bacterium]|nr:hypothetical protein [Peptococcaceae bacterium]
LQQKNNVSFKKHKKLKGGEKNAQEAMDVKTGSPLQGRLQYLVPGKTLNCPFCQKSGPVAHLP